MLNAPPVHMALLDCADSHAQSVGAILHVGVIVYQLGNSKPGVPVEVAEKSGKMVVTTVSYTSMTMGCGLIVE